MSPESVRDHHPEAIVSTDDLAACLDEATLRVYECTVYLHPRESGPDAPYVVESGRADYEAGHIPGSGFLDIAGDLSDPDAATHFMMPTAERFAAGVGAQGLGDGCRVVLYSRGTPQWATRMWWMLRAMGFDAAVLDGGFETWRDEGRPLSTDPATYPPATFTPRPRDGLFVGRDAVRAAIGDDATVTVNALLPELHRGESGRYGRPGRVPGSVNVPLADLVEGEAMAFVDLATAEGRLHEAGVTADKKVLAYCGGGIAATLDAFMMHRLGYGDIAVYDASMSEWAKDESLPIETG
jgi:thiosulfate/3-mercaptopyruvate sulfurtransferase